MNIEAIKSFDIEYVSPTGLDCFVRCPARYYFSKLERLISPTASRTAMDFGGCLHCCLHAAYTDPGKAMKIFDARAEEEKITWDDKRNPLLAHQLINMFHQFHSANRPYKPLDPPVGIIDCDDKQSDYECPFLLDIGGEYLMYGKVDRPVEYQGLIWPLDYKTSGWVQSNYFENFETCAQTLAYTLAMSYLFKTECKGMIVELIKTTITKTQSSIPNISFHPIFTNQQWLETFVEFTRWKMKEMRLYNEHKQWPKNPCACGSYGMFGVQGYLCEYHPLCQVASWQDAARFFMREEWSPLKSVKDKNVVRID